MKIRYVLLTPLAIIMVLSILKVGTDISSGIFTPSDYLKVISMICVIWFTGYAYGRDVENEGWLFKK